jgi:hypothetical protein
MDGLFIAALTVAAFGALLLAGFGLTAGLIAITRGPAAAKQFLKEEW